jgi:hypothetical protein
VGADGVPFGVPGGLLGGLLGEFRASGLGAMRMVVLDIMPITVRRTPELISQADPDVLKLLLVCGTGCSVVEQDNRQVRSASDFAIYSTRRPSPPLITCPCGHCISSSMRKV